MQNKNAFNDIENKPVVFNKRDRSDLEVVSYYKDKAINIKKERASKL